MFGRATITLDIGPHSSVILICTGNVGLIMAALWNRAGHYIFVMWFLLLSFFLSFFFPRLISAVTDCMSAILPHMVWP